MDPSKKYFANLRAWFPDIPEAELGRFLIRQLPAGELLVCKDDFFKNLFIILDGTCDVINQLDNGADIITLKLSCGDVIGVSESVTGNARNFASVKSCTRLTVAELDNGMFNHLLDTCPSFTRFVLKNLVARLHYTADFAANCQTSASDINLAKYLMDRYMVERSTYPQSYTGTVAIRETHEMIANFLGISTRTLERHIRALRADGLIDTVKGKISISPAQYQNLQQLVTSNL